MARYDVGPTTLNLFPDGLQDDITVQNLGPDPVYYDETSAVSSDNGAILSVGQSVVWERKRPLYLISKSFSRVRTVRNSQSPNSVTDRWLPIATGRFSGSGALQINNDSSSSSVSTAISSEVFSSIQIQIRAQTGFTILSVPIVITVRWYDTSDNVAAATPIATTNHFVRLGSTAAAAFAITTVLGPRFTVEFQYFSTPGNLSALPGPATLAILGSFNRELERVQIATEPSSGNITLTHSDNNKISFRAVANAVGFLYFSCPAPRMNASIRLDAVAVAGRTAYLEIGGMREWFNNAASGVMGVDMAIAAGGSAYNGLYYPSPNSYVALNLGGFVAAYDQLVTGHFTFFN